MSHPTATKRPAQTGVAPDDARAECPFTVRLVDPASGVGGGANGSRNPKKRRKRDRDQTSGDGDGTPGATAAAAASPADGAAAGGSGTAASRRVLHQAAPFAPRGGFATHSTLDVHYAVEPARAWSEMTRYNSFVLNGVKYFCEGFVYVANEESLQRQKAAASARARQQSSAAAGTAAGADATADTAGAAAGRRFDDDWVARILEIRASDEHHVYARVFWMYWPDELPAHTVHDSNSKKKKTVPGGRQPHHGASELLASNHMDIINVVSVTSMATVNHLIEDRDDDIQSALYWRQALDVRTMEVSAIETACACGMPANPDKMLIGCGSEACGKWIHEECLKHYALMRVFERLGRYKPHVAAPASASKKHRKLALRNGGGPTDDDDDENDEDDDDDVKRPLSPSESGGAASVQPSINVKPEGEKDEEATKTPGSGRRGRRSGGAGSAGVGSNGKTKKTEAAPRGRKRKPRASDASAYEEVDEENEHDDEEDDADEDYDDADEDEEDYDGTRSRKTRHTPLRRRREAFSPFSSADGGGGLATPTPGSSGSRLATARQQRQQQQQQQQQRQPTRPPPKNQPYHNPYPPLHAFGPGSGPGGKRKPPPPYDKLFEATVLLPPAAAENGSALPSDGADTDGADAAAAAAAAAAPTMIEIRDLRPGVTGGERVWLEPAECPLCGSAIR